MDSNDAVNSVWDENEFDALLNEFNTVMEDLSCPTNNGVQYEEHLNQMKMSSAIAADSGIDDSDSTGSSAGSSLNCSIEKLNSVDTTTSKAKLGDTRDLEDFIADLDQTLAEMM
ncbi:regulator of cell cycle RGCC-like [Scyliorhinus canicula]|uniref:regulator of cell cycle RGCC-like n=1 Tax=Scyliorhinus canicula TaxID=7830 RepID=UPI0018F2952C|nr:regulator of cell cycle RGCC-like [Scyliorhinus canicula]